MFEFLTALSMAVVVFCYWVSCRRASLKHRRKAVEELELIASKHGVESKELALGVNFYREMTSWASLPMLTITGISTVAGGVFSGAIERHAKVSRPADTAMRAAFSMYVTRNPLTSFLCLFTMSSLITVFTTAAIALNKLKAAAPSVTEAYQSLVELDIDSRGDKMRRH